MYLSTSPLGGSYLIKYAYHRSTCTGYGDISDHNHIRLIYFSCFLPSVVAELITVYSPLGKSGSLVFQTLAENPYTSAYAMNHIHKTWKSLCSPPNVGSQTEFVDISMFMFPASCPASGLSRPTSNYVGYTLYLLRLTTGKLSSACINCCSPKL